MKVLFAVSNENISEEIIKRYPKEYKELISYKNVYYFNAILKEIQKDKSYDRIVISEDLEPFVNTNHDSIDNFIFEHLDKISDEAHDNEGKETSIILICSERRAPGSSILNKLFSIGVYNAIMGNDRNMQELCKLINRPRTKKEAKLYYRIDQATYDPITENEVSEVEIQNILAHFRKLGKNTERYADSFNNIAAQYTDDQLKIIINVLPIKVKAILESDSHKYQSLMGTSSPSTSGEMKIAPIEPGIKVNTIGKSSNINGPIVIPSSVKKVTSKAFSGANNSNIVQKSNQNTINTDKAKQIPNVVASKTVLSQEVKNVRAVQKPNQNQDLNKNVVKVTRPIINNSNESNSNRIVNSNIKTVGSNVNTVNSNANNVNIDKLAVASKVNMERKVNPSNVNISQNSVKANTLATEIEGVDMNSNDQNQEVSEVKRGRGRPKKIVEGPPKPKGKRGRPRKNAEPQVQTNLNNDLSEVLPGLEDDLDEISLPGLEESSFGNDFNDNSDNSFGDTLNTDEEVLPGLDEDMFYNLEGDSNDETLSDLSVENSDEEIDVSSLLASLDDSSDEDMLPGLDDESSNSLPGLDEFDDGTLPGLNNDSVLSEDVFEDEILPGLDNSSLENTIPGLDEEESILPGVDNILNDDSIITDSNIVENTNAFDDGVLSGLEDEKETILPGMGFEDTTESSNINNPYANNTNAIESIKPKVDYSMSNLNSLLSKDKKIVTFLGTTKNGTSFLVNNLALMFSLMGINTAILDMTQNRNSYYIFTDSREELRNIAYTSISKLENGYAEGIKVNKNLTVYTALPADGNKYENAEPILSTLVQNHSLVLIDCDFETPPAYFASCQEIYLVQSMDILTIQPLTAFIRDLKFKGAWEPEKARVVINKETKIKCLNNKMIIAGMSRYNGPDMSVMTDLFNRDMVKACSIPFDEKVYAKYLETMATCKLSLSGYSKPFMSKMQILGEMVYPRLNSKKSYGPIEKNNFQNTNMNSGNVFSNNTNNTLNQMKNRY